MNTIKNIFFVAFGLFCVAFAAVAYAQGGSVTPGGLFDKVYDRFGNTYQLADLAINSTKTQGHNGTNGTPNIVNTVQPICSAGYFQVFVSNTSIYLDPSNTAQINVLCQVLSDISNFLPRPANATGTVNIFLYDWGVLAPPPANALAVATSCYSYPILNTTIGGIVDGEVWKTIMGGRDSYEGIVPPFATTTNNLPIPQRFFHGLISFNTTINWHTDFRVQPTNTENDMYSVLLHEVTHALGFASLINSNGQSVMNLNPTYYSRYDFYLKNALGTSLLNSINVNDTEMYDNQFDANLLTHLGNGVCTGPYPNTTDCATAIIYDNGNTIQRQEVYNPVCYARGSSLSHFEDECASSTRPSQNDLYFVMSNGIDVGPHYEKHYLKPEERNVLCDLGYEVGVEYGTNSNVDQLPFNYGATSLCADPRPVGYSDGINTISLGSSYTYTTTINSPMQIYDILNNDVNATTATAFEVILGGGSLSAISSNGFTYTPSVTGLHLIRYIPVSSTGRKGNITYIFMYIFAENSPNCGINPCNRIPNSGFEIASHCGPWDGEPPPACWNLLQGTPDSYIENCQLGGVAWVAQNLFSFGQNGFHSVITPFPYNHGVSGATNTAFVGLLSSAFTGSEWDEAIQTTLTTPLVAGVSYRVKFHAATSFANTTTTPYLIIAASPQPIPPNAIANFDNLQNNPLVHFFGASANIPMNVNGLWSEYQAVFTYPQGGATPDLHNLIIATNHHLLPPAIGECYFYIDDISLIEDDGGLPFTLPSCFTVGTPIILDASSLLPNVVFSGDDVLNNVLTPVAGHGNYIVYYEYIKSNGCTMQGSATITEDAGTPVIVVNRASCVGTSVQLAVNTGLSFIWSTGETRHYISVTPNTPTAYTVTVTFCSGATATASIIVTPQTPTLVSIDPTDPCVIDNIDIYANPSNLQSYTWSTGAITQNANQSVANVAPGSFYYVTATDSNGCTSVASTFINPPPTVTIQGVNVYAGYSIVLNAVAQSPSHSNMGNSVFTYDWSNGDTNKNTTINSDGSYTVTVTETNIYGTCTASATFEVGICKPSTQASVFIGAPNTTTYWSQMPNTPTANTQYIVDGELVLDRILQISDGDFLMQPGSHIQIDAKSVDFLHCQFQAACGMMWRGISIYGQRLLSMQKSTVRDAHFGIETLQKSRILSLDNQFIDCYIGIYTPDGEYEVEWLRPMDRNAFSTSIRGLLPPYPNQPIEQSARRGKAGAWLFGYQQFDMGIYASNGVIGRNTFTNLSNGVVFLATNAHLENTEMMDIIPDHAYDNPPPLPDMPDASLFNGTAIMANGGYEPSPSSPNFGGFVVSQHLLEVVDNNVFARCNIGIYANATNTVIDGIRIYKPRIAINIQQPEHAEIVVRNNIIHSCRGRGIALNGVGTHGCVAIIERNNISIISGGGISLESIYGIDDMPTISVRNNTIDLKGTEGIYALDCKHVDFIDNQVNLLADRQNKAGIHIDGCEHLNFSCNAIQNPSSAPPIASNANNGLGSPPYFPAGFVAAASTDCLIACTTTQNCYTGMLFESDCTGTEIQTSSIGNSIQGLVFSPSLLLQDQIGNGNHFTGSTYLGAMASHKGIPFQGLLPGIFRCPASTTETPTNSWAMPNVATTGNTPALGLWYQDFFLTQTCSTTCNPGVQASTTSPDATYMQRIAKAMYKHPEYEAEMHKWSQNTLYEKLKEQPNLMQNDSVLTNFMATKDSTVAAGLYTTKTAIAAAGKLNASDKTIRAAHAAQRTTIATQLKAISEQLASNPLADTATLYAQQRALYEALHTENTTHQGYLVAFAQQRAAKIATAKQENNAVAPTVAVYEANEKTVNEIMLNTVEAGIYHFTTAEKQAINDIANSCPMVAGHACYRARSLRSVYEPNLYYNDIDLCQRVGIAFRKLRSDIKESMQYSIFPNPANNAVTVRSNTPFIENSNVVLNDVFGRVVLSKMLAKIEIQSDMDITNIPAGMYILQINSENTTLFTEKLIIIK